MKFINTNELNCNNKLIINYKIIKMKPEGLRSTYFKNAFKIFLTKSDALVKLTRCVRRGLNLVSRTVYKVNLCFIFLEFNLICFIFKSYFVRKCSQVYRSAV